MTHDTSSSDDEPVIPALFATIHHQSDERPDGYTAEDIEELNRLANQRRRKRLPQRRTLYIAGGAFVLVGALLAGTVWISPMWMPGRIEKAAEIGDRSKLEQLVDFPAIRTALKIDAKDMMKATYRSEIASSGDPFAMMFSGIGDSIVDAAADALVDQLVTPLALEKAARGEDVPFNFLGDTRSALPDFRHVRDGMPTFTARGRYLTLARYEFTLRSIGTDQKFDIQMRRTGPFSWRIDKVKIDPSFLTSLQTKDRQAGTAPPETLNAERALENDVTSDPGDYKWERTDEDYAASRDDDERIGALYNRSDCGDLVGPERTGCWESEQQFQDQRLNAEYAALRSRLDTPAKENLRQLQLSWIKSRDRECANPELGSVGWAAAACMTNETAKRRLFLQDYRP
ncbi:hypothetical protein SH203_01915 [Brevundimonas sp. SH203]|uniref:DUF2939 domain-containing protein n=1 Tax=Brevundimonas sp. SH203 TaxID=345167 RepID=UPI0009C7C310|nr:DUF2939 domain-containing protein [Brevundimonas sp. SH203]GAW41507.1 hypothetical protein SH203_01915 [Brevundimonas sp. SH203]